MRRNHPNVRYERVLIMQRNEHEYIVALNNNDIIKVAVDHMTNTLPCIHHSSQTACRQSYLDDEWNAGE